MIEEEFKKLLVGDIIIVDEKEFIIINKSTNYPNSDTLIFNSTKNIIYWAHGRGWHNAVKKLE